MALDNVTRKVFAIAEAKRRQKISDIAAKEMARNCDARIAKAKARVAEADVLLNEALNMIVVGSGKTEQKIRRFLKKKFEV